MEPRAWLRRRIADKVQHHLLDLNAIDQDWRKPRREVEPNMNLPFARVDERQAGGLFNHTGQRLHPPGGCTRDNEGA